MFFDLRSFDHSGWKVISGTGDVDLATMPQLASSLAEPVGDVALDLTGVGHFDPICFGVVISADLRARRRGDRFRVVCPKGRVRSLLAESSVDQIIEVADVLEELSL